MQCQLRKAESTQDKVMLREQPLSMLIYFYQLPYRNNEESSQQSDSLDTYCGKFVIYSRTSGESLGLLATQALQVYQISRPMMYLLD